MVEWSFQQRLCQCHGWPKAASASPKSNHQTGHYEYIQLTLLLFVFCSSLKYRPMNNWTWSWPNLQISPSQNFGEKKNTRKKESLQPLFNSPSGIFNLHLRWHHLQALPRSAQHVKRKCIGWNNSLLTTRCTTNLASDVTTVRVPSRWDQTKTKE